MFATRDPLAALAALCALSVGACGGDDRPEAASLAPEQPAFDAQDASKVARRCIWTVGQGRQISEKRIRDGFIDATGGNELGLLLEKQEVRPGEQFAISLMNSSDESFLYGTQTQIEDSTGDPVPTKGPSFFPAIGLSSEPGEAGQCVTASVPSTTEPGSYRVVLVTEGAPNGEGFSAPIEVFGDPVAR